MNKKIKDMIISAEYESAKVMFLKMSNDEKRDAILEIAYEIESLGVYSFVVYMMNYDNKVQWLKIAIDIMLNPLCFIEGAYSVALYHSKELLKIEYSLENMERLLFFYNIPERLLSHEEANKIAKEILIVEPHNLAALKVTS